MKKKITFFAFLSRNGRFLCFLPVAIRCDFEVKNAQNL